MWPAAILPLLHADVHCRGGLIAAYACWLSKCAAEGEAPGSQAAISGATAAPASAAECSCGCEQVLLRPRRGCVREANWAEERQHEVRWGALHSGGSFRQDMMPVIGCALERVILQHRLWTRTIADTYTRQHHPQQTAQCERTAALHGHKSSCCPTTQLLAQHSSAAC